MSTKDHKNNSMKSVLFLSMCLFLFAGCNSSDGEMMEKLMNSDGNSAEELKGDFVSDAHPTSGSCAVSADKSNLSLTNFKTDEGPKLLMYLSTDVDSKDYVDLGDLKGVEGDFNYAIPANTDLDKYKFVVVWCVDFSVSFGHAELK